MKSLKDFYKGKVILVTGGAGSIGSEIVRKLLDYEPEVVRVFDNNETGLFELQQQLQKEKARLFTGDIRDKERAKRAVEDVDLVFHAAALKHVPLCEYNPSDAVKTNVIGTQNIIDVAMDEEVDKLITISTDKVANPVNVLGATKLLAERLTTSANFYKGKRKTAFSCVRFGNVLGSRGSVVPVFKKQIESGGPVTLTSKKMTRFVMSIPEAVAFILRAAEMAQGGEVFIPRMPAIRIIDLAEVMIDELTSKNGNNYGSVKLRTIGNRAGEKLYEELLTEDEAMITFENDVGLIMTSRLANKNEKRLTRQLHKYTSDNARLLTKAEIKLLLMEAKLL